MTNVELTCITCGKVTEVNGEDFFDMKKRGLILNPSYRGKGKQIDCCGGTKKAPSRGKKKSKAKTSTKAKKPSTTPNDRHKKSTTKKSKAASARLTSSGIYFVDGKFPPTITVEEDGRDFVLVLPYSGRGTKLTVNELKFLGVETRVASNGESSAVYADSKTFKYVMTRVKGHGMVVVYKDIKNPPKQIKIRSKEGAVTIKKVLRVKGTMRDIERKLNELDEDIYNYFKAKVFGIRGKYFPKTYDIFVDNKSKKPPKSTKPRLSKDFKKYVKRFGMDPHCSACTNPNCDEAGVSGDDACGSGFRSGL